MDRRGSDGSNNSDPVLKARANSESRRHSNERKGSFLPEVSSLQTITERKYKRKTFWKPAYSGLVAPSAVCTQRYHQYLWDEKKLQVHVEKIIRAEPRVDCKPPVLSSRYFFKEKKLRDMANLLKERDAQNKALIDRVLAAATSKRYSRVDCWNKDYREMLKFEHVPEYKERQKRIKRENVVLLERLMAIPPSQDSHRTHLMEEYDRHLKLKRHLRKFPKIPTHTVLVGDQTKVPQGVLGRDSIDLPPI